MDNFVKMQEEEKRFDENGKVEILTEAEVLILQ